MTRKIILFFIVLYFWPGFLFAQNQQINWLKEKSFQINNFLHYAFFENFKEGAEVLKGEIFQASKDFFASISEKIKNIFRFFNQQPKQEIFRETETGGKKDNSEIERLKNDIKELKNRILQEKLKESESERVEIIKEILNWKKELSSKLRIEGDFFELSQTNNSSVLTITSLTDVTTILNQQTNFFAKTYGGGNHEYTWNPNRGIKPTPDGGYILLGNTDSFGVGDYDLFVVKLDSSGWVGLGVTNPAQHLDVAGNIQAQRICLGGVCYSSFPVNFWSFSSSSFGVDAIFNAGNVGIGVINPSQKLTVAGNIGIQAGTTTFIGNLDDYALGLRTNNIDRIYITNDGKVSIGTTTPAFKLDVYGPIGTIPTSSSVAGTALHWDSTTREIYAYTSSLRFKSEISDLDIDSSKIFQLKPRSFKPINNQDRTFGLIAEEVFDVLPELVNLDSDGKPFSIKFELLSVLMLNEFKKQHLSIDENGELAIGEKSIKSGENTSLFEAIKKFVKDILKEINEIFVERIKTREVCVEGEDGETICLTKDQLKTIINSQKIINNQNVQTDNVQTDNENKILEENLENQTTTDSENQITTEETVD